MRIGGIDPGKSGALVVIDGWKTFEDAEIIVCKVPLIKVKVGKKEKTKPDYVQMASLWSEVIYSCDHVFIERVGAMPKQGAASTFNFGYVAGAAYGLLVAQKIPHTFVTPQVWKKKMGLSGDDKDKSRERASQLLPRFSENWKLVKDDGVAEAALLCYFGGLALGKQDPEATL